MKMKQHLELRSSFSNHHNSNNITLNQTTATAIIIPPAPSFHKRTTTSSFTLLHSLFNFLSLHRPHWLSTTLRRHLTGTLFGHRHGHVTFSLQLDPRGEPLTLLHLDISTTALLKEMSSGLLRIALESHKIMSPSSARRPAKLLKLPTWTMYCNGRETGQALSRTCGPYDRHMLHTIRSVSVGAGVIPVLHDGGKAGSALEQLGELVYMRADFERVVGSADSEALFMINPDGNVAPELSIFLLRI